MQHPLVIGAPRIPPSEPQHADLNGPPGYPPGGFLSPGAEWGVTIGRPRRFSAGTQTRDGPKLVTTPGSDFSTLCSLLFEAVSGNADEGLAGAINRYARSEDRKRWDREGEEEQDPEDNFLVE